MHIRPVDPGDLPELLDMVRALAMFHGDRPGITLQALARDTLGPAPWLRVLVGQGRAGLLAYAALSPRVRLQYGQRGMEIDHLFVCEGDRGAGLGRRMLDAATQQARRDRCDFVTIGTVPENSRARAVYAACGFEPHATDPNRFRIDLRTAPGAAQIAVPNARDAP